MDEMTDKAVTFQLDSEKGILYLNDLLMDSTVYLYDENGELQVKKQYTLSSLVIQLPKRGTYVLVLFHPICKMIVKKIIF